ncbi:hypothetical protein BDZ89DRAFT_1160519 [Hymenopellis radicata]|nr:hypothetical protein BDZ89DRAFT_1160519 [Hymenopellis radicata]
MPKHGYRKPSDKFNRIFYSAAKGNALWSPSPRRARDVLGTGRTNGYWDEGMLIGDLFLRTSMGEVSYLWNVTLPKDDFRNTYGAPPDFEQLHLDPSTDFTVDPLRFPSPGVFGATCDKDKPLVIEELNGPNKLRVSSTASEGALFALPLGAASYECTASGISKLRAHALKHARRWHEHISDKLNYGWTNGLMCLVTGCEKTSYWASAVFDTAERFSLDIDMVTSPTSPIFVPNGEFTGNFQSHQVGKKDAEDTATKRHSLTFRAFHISMHPSLFLNLPTIQMDGHRPLDFFFCLPLSLRPPVKSYEEEFVSFHPSLVVNQLIHRSVPGIMVAVVHDDDIVNVLDSDASRLPDEKELQRLMTQRFVLAITPERNAYLMDRSEVHRGVLGRCLALLRIPLTALGLLSFAAVREKP